MAHLDSEIIWARADSADAILEESVERAVVCVVSVARAEARVADVGGSGRRVIGMSGGLRLPQQMAFIPQDNGVSGVYIVFPMGTIPNADCLP